MDETKAAGADIVGNDGLMISKLEKINFDVLIATPTLYGNCW